MKTGWTKESALAELAELAKDTYDLTRYQRFSEYHTRWVMRVLALLEEVFGENSRYYLSFAALRWKETGSVIVGGINDPEGAFNPHAAIERKHHEAYLKQLEAARGFLLAAKDHLERTDMAAVYQGKDTGPESSAIVEIINLAQHRLRKIIRKPPEFEQQVQESFENLLIGAEIAYSRETDRIEYSSKTYIPDFVITKLDLAIDLKLCNRAQREKEIIAEVNDDIMAYKTKYGNLLFVVYDTGHIRDTERFKAVFEQNENVVVVVVKH